MKRECLYPIRRWFFMALALPLAFAAGSVAVIATIKTDALTFDGAKFWWLGGLIPISGLLLVYGAWRRRTAVNRFTALSPLLAKQFAPGRAIVRASVLVLCIAMLVAAILGPRWGMYLEKQKAYGVDIVVAVDVSRSMLAVDVSPNRLERAKQELRQQLVERGIFKQGSRLALLAFAGSTSLKLPLTTDHFAFRNKLEALNVGSAPRGGTAIAEAIRSAAELLTKSPENATKIILVVTDGEDHQGGPIEAAQDTHSQQKVEVYCVGVGNPNSAVGAEVPGPQGRKPLLHDGQIVFSKLDPSALRSISEAGGGAYAPLEDLSRLVTRMASMKKTELSVEERMRHQPRYQWFVAAALVLLAIETLMTELRATREGEPSRTWQLETA